jgi:hypothetical protein
MTLPSADIAIEVQPFPGALVTVQVCAEADMMWQPTKTPKANSFKYSAVL